MAFCLLSAILSGCLQQRGGFDILSAERSVLHRNHGIVRQPVEVGVRTPISGSSHHVLIANPHINSLVLRASDGRVLVSTGDSLPFFQRPLPHRQFILPLPVSDSVGKLALSLSKAGENLFYEIRLLDDAALKDYLAEDLLLTGFLIGFYMLAILLSLALLLYNPTVKYLCFWLYIVFSLAWILGDAGLLYQWIWPGRPDWHRISRGFFSSLSMVLFILYLGRTENQILSRGVKLITYVLLGFLGLKILSAFLSVMGLFPEEFKFDVLRFNAFSLTLLMGSILLSLCVYLSRTRKDVFEVLAIAVYCLFVVFLGLRELGVNTIRSGPLHQFDAMLFFPFQCLFMAAHLYNRERRREREAEKRQAQLSLSQQREADRRVREVEESERRRIAQNMHDEIGSIFAALKYQMLSLIGKGSNLQREDLDRLISLTETGISRQYSIIDDLLFEIRSGMSLRESIGRQLDLVIREDIQASYCFDAREDLLNDFQKTQVHRIVSELLTNTIRHAGARRVSIHIEGDETVAIRYADDGKGFDPVSNGRGRGLEGMRTRVMAMGGTMELSGGSEGMRCDISVPL